MSAVYWVGSDLPDLAVTWKDSSLAVIDFSAGHTFVLKLAPIGTAAASFTKTTGITGAATAPNVTVAWSISGELNSLAPGIYVLQITATRTADSKDRIMEQQLEIRSRVV